MAIKIVNEKPDPSVVKNAICDNCGVKMEYTPADTREWRRTDYTGDTECHDVIDCPKCSNVIIV